MEKKGKHCRGRECVKTADQAEIEIIWGIPKLEVVSAHTNAHKDAQPCVRLLSVKVRVTLCLLRSLSGP